MRAMDKMTFLADLHEKVDLQLQEATKVFQNLSEGVLLKQPPSGGWSAAQCFEHLNRYGNYYLPQIRKATQQSRASDPDKTFTNGWLGSYFSRMMDPDTGKTKIKTFKEYVPSPQLDAHTVVAEFIHQQETMLKYLDHARRADLNRRIPISLTSLVRLRLGDVFQFVIAHNARHLEQAKRAIT